MPLSSSWPFWPSTRTAYDRCGARNSIGILLNRGGRPTVYGGGRYPGEGRFWADGHYGAGIDR